MSVKQWASALAAVAVVVLFGSSMTGAAPPGVVEVVSPATPGPAGETVARSTSSVSACVRGFMSYKDNFAITLPAPNLTVRVFDRGPSDLLLATGITASDGSYQICFDNDDDEIFGAGQDPYVIISTENARWRVHDNNRNVYSIRVDGPDDVADGSTTNLGSRQAPTDLRRAWHAFDQVNLAWNVVPHGNTACWDPNDSVCHPQIWIMWAPGLNGGNHFCPTVGGGMPGQCPVANEIHLNVNTPDSHTLLHELGHAYMFDVYEHQGPFGVDCAGHTMGVSLTRECAWMEGWANWFALGVSGAHNFKFESGGSYNLEDPTSPNWDTGDATEGRVTGALLDLADGANNGQLVNEAWDEFSGNPQSILATFIAPGNAVSTFGQFFNLHRATMSPALADSLLAAVYQNTIDYGFRPALTSRNALRRPTPLVPTNYSFNTTRNFWSVMAISPETADLDLHVHGIATGGSVSSTLSYDNDLPTPDFVAIDGNRRAEDIYHAMVYQPDTKSSVYTVEFVDGDTTIAAGTTTVNLGVGHNVTVRDVLLSAGQRISVKADPTVLGQYPQLFLMASDPDVPATTMQPRLSAVASGLPVGSSRSATTPQYIAPRTAWYGIVLVNKKPTVGGNYTVTVTIS